MIKTIQSVTFGYSDSEDRLWVRCLMKDEDDVRFWITRRLTLALIEAMGIKLRETLPALPVPMAEDLRLAVEYQSALEIPREPAPPAPENPVARTQELPLCHTVDISTHPSHAWAIVWKVAGAAPLALTANRQTIHRLLAALINRAEAAGWAPALSQSWLIPELRNSLLGNSH